MPSIEESFIAMVNQDPGLKVYVADRVYDTQLPPETLMPCLTFQMIGDRDTVHMGGNVAAHPIFLQTDVYADDAGVRRTVRILLDNAMRRWTGLWAGIRINRALRDGTPFNSTVPGWDGGPNDYHRSTARWAVHVSDQSIVTP